MQAMLFSCDTWSATRGRSDGLLHEIAETATLLERALDVAAQIGAYTRDAVQGTKPGINAEFVDGLHRIAGEAKAAHRKAFSAGEAQRRMRKILGIAEPEVAS
jgi:hypothetical protein